MEGGVSEASSMGTPEDPDVWVLPSDGLAPTACEQQGKPAEAEWKTCKSEMLNSFILWQTGAHKAVRALAPSYTQTFFFTLFLCVFILKWAPTTVLTVAMKESAGGIRK